MFSSMFPRTLTDLSASYWALLPFNPLNCFTISFWDNSNSVSLNFGLPVYSKWSPVYSTLANHWQTSKGLNDSMSILSDLELRVLPYIAPPITAISGCQDIDYIMPTKLSGGFVGRWFVTLKSIQGTTGLCDGKPFDFMQPFYIAL